MSESKPAVDRRLGWLPLDYSVELYDGEIQRVELPFVVAILADLSGYREELQPLFRDRKFRQIDAENLDDILSASNTRVQFKVKNWIAEEQDQDLPVQLKFEALDDFQPGQVAKMVPQLATLIEARSSLASLAIHLEVRPQTAGKIKAWLQLPDSLAGLKQLYLDNFAQAQEEDELDSELVVLPEWLSELLTDHAAFLLADSWRFDIEELPIALVRKISEIDLLLCRQLDDILHHPDLQRLEATWRGLAYLARQTESGSLLKLRVMNATKKEIDKELMKAVEFDQSSLFKKLYEEEIYMMGGEPYGLILCDYEVSHSPQDVALLSNMAPLSAACSAPSLFGVAPALFNMDSWDELHRPRDLAKIFETPEYTRWRSLRDNVDASYLTLVMPGLLARGPWNTVDDVAVHGFAYQESTESNRDYLWMNSAFGMAAVITNAFARDRWCIDFRGPRWGRMEGLPAHFIIENEEIVNVIGPTEKDISDRRHMELENLGLTSISRHRRGDFAAVLTPRSLRKARAYDTELAETQEALSIQLEHQLVIGRIHHVIRSYLRDHSSYFGDWKTLAERMQAWLSSFCVKTPDEKQETPQDSMLQAPFRSVDVRVNDLAGKDNINIEIELVLNYLPKGEPIARVLILHPPPGVLSSRLVP